MQITEDDGLTRLSKLIGLIYEGATDPGRWTKDILPAVAEYIDAPACILYSPLHAPTNGGYFFLHGITQEHVDQYAHKYFEEDVWKIALQQKKILNTGNIIIGDEVVPRSQLLASSFYKECLSLNRNMAQLITGFVFGMDSHNSMPTTCSFFRGLHQADFDDGHRKRLRLILPHLSRSLGVMQRLRSAELAIASTLDALDRLPSGILLLDHSGAVAFANRSAVHILEEGDGLRLRKLTHSQGLGNLVAENAATSQSINKAVRAALKHDPYDTPHFSKWVSVPQTSGRASYTLQLSALGKHSEFGGESGAYAAIIFIADGAQAVAIDPASLQSAYGLTPAETKVAVALLDASTAQEVAVMLKISANTVNTHIKRIYSKLGVDTRARFVKLMLGLAASPL